MMTGLAVTRVWGSAFGDMGEGCCSLQGVVTFDDLLEFVLACSVVSSFVESCFFAH